MPDCKSYKEPETMKQSIFQVSGIRTLMWSLDVGPDNNGSDSSSDSEYSEKDSKKVLY